MVSYKKTDPLRHKTFEPIFPKSVTSFKTDPKVVFSQENLKGIFICSYNNQFFGQFAGVYLFWWGSMQKRVFLANDLIG